MANKKDIYYYASQIFMPIVRKLEPIFPTVKYNLKAANIDVSPEKYLAMIIFVFPITLIAASFFVYFYLFILFPELRPSSNIITFTIPILAAFIASLTAYYYPKTLAEKRRGDIDNSLIFAAIYLSTITRSGFPPQEAFKLLSKFKEYKEIARESGKITKDVEALGIDLPKALSRAIARSPSPQWTEILSGLKSGITTGGDISAYLEEKAHSLIAARRRVVDEYSKRLSTIMQIYIGFVVVGSSLLIVMSTLMSSMGGIPLSQLQFMQYLGVVLGIPLITFIFIMIIKETSPWK